MTVSSIFHQLPRKVPAFCFRCFFLERGYETLCNIFRFATNVNSFRFHFISRFHFLHKSQAFDFTSFLDSSCINHKLPILPHFHLCWLKKLTSLGKLHVPQPNQNPAFSFSGVQRLSTCFIMTRKLNSIMDITAQKAARINIGMILMDENADKIVAQIKDVDPDKWNDVVKVGKTYMIQNFEFEKNIGQFRPTKHAFKLNFVTSTKVKEQDFPMIPEMVYGFTLFDDVLTGSANPDYLIVRSLSWIQKLINLSLWANVIGELVDVLQWSLDGKPKKVVLTMKDKWLFINEDLKDIEDYKNRFDPSQLSLVTCSQRLSQVSYSAQPTSEDRFLYNAQVKSLSELCELKKECVCVAVAMITKFLVGNGWIYESCPKCNKKVECEKFPYTCQGCGNEMRVGQPNETANFTLWDRECNALIKESAKGEFDPKDIVEAIDRILGKKLAFRFKAIWNNTRYSVSQISEDEDLIMLLLKRLPTYETEKVLKEDVFEMLLIIRIGYMVHQICQDKQAIKAWLLTLTSPQRLKLKRILHNITNTQPNSQHMPTRQRKTINNIFSLRSNLYSDFVAASSASTGLLDNEILDRSFVPQHANDSLHHTNEALSDNNAENAGYVGLGDLSQICAYCQAAMWYQESTRKNRNQANLKYSLCCSMGRIHLPFLKNPPMLFQQLLCEEESCESKNYQQNIRAYNMMFAFNSPGAKIDTSLLKGKVVTQVNDGPNYLVYITDGIFCICARSNLLDSKLMSKIKDMFDEYNKENLNLQLIVDKKKDGRIYNLPIVLKVVVVIVGDASQPINRDIILEKKNGRLQRINEFYPGYLGLQYPLLFPYGEDGYRSDIKHRDMDDSHERKRNKLTIRVLVF
ncbi:hypothetical protein HKD37_09G025134 [Glycine soja]